MTYWRAYSMVCLPELTLRPPRCNGFFICWPKIPETQKILRQEVLLVVGNSTFATPETLSRTPYLMAWLRETLCLYPVFSALPRRSKVDIILGGLPYPWGHWLTWVEAFKPLMARIVQQFDISYPPGAKNVEPFIRGVTVPNRPVRVQFVDSWEWDKFWWQLV